ncbi:hypothetical protein DC522_17255 [Microvirga sp. KLBC 81]|nr:hypothetical protein DC522_17255 [Microvirga sp. KLBC 81]
MALRRALVTLLSAGAGRTFRRLCRWTSPLGRGQYRASRGSRFRAGRRCRALGALLLAFGRLALLATRALSRSRFFIGACRTGRARRLRGCSLTTATLGTLAAFLIRPAPLLTALLAGRGLLILSLLSLTGSRGQLGRVARIGLSHGDGS